MKNDNLNITFSIGRYMITILKFTYECQTWNTPSHSHSSNSYELHYIPQGRGTLISSQKSYDLYPNVLYTTGPHVEHQQYPDPDDPTYEYCIYLRIEETHAKQRRKNMEQENIMDLFLNYPFWYGTDQADLPVTLEQIHRELFHPKPAAGLMLEALFIQFMVKVLRNYKPASKAAITSIPIPLIKAYILIEDSFLLEYDTITLEELSHRLGLSTRQTSRILFDRYGQNFIQKRTEARMAAAVTFLKEGRLSVSEIAARLGYSCPNHFHAAFKKYYHMTATEYKSLCLSQN
ncbi:MAG: AraC family transcriptional regulator [Lachnospiraceae bacterium]|nr:AraC family transcriptional regulator [Lachnospiraceae bacterium]HJC79625.1 AraC family transcriptional regulator [Candidatus Mediterraneibacter excrementipullorum]